MIFISSSCLSAKHVHWFGRDTMRLAAIGQKRSCIAHGFLSGVELKIHQWVNLTTRYGVTIQSPSQEQLEETLQELFTTEINNEHPDCWIECGTQAGELLTLSVFQSGYAIYTKYSDFDMSEEIQSRELKPIDYNSALELWTKLIENGTCTI